MVLTLKLFHDGGPYHKETNPLIHRPNCLEEQPLLPVYISNFML